MGCAPSSARLAPVHYRGKVQPANAQSSTSARNALTPAKKTSVEKKYGQETATATKKISMSVDDSIPLSHPSGADPAAGAPPLPSLVNSSGEILCHPIIEFKNAYILTRRSLGRGSFGQVLLAEINNAVARGNETENFAVKFVEIALSGDSEELSKGVLLTLDDLISSAVPKTATAKQQLKMLKREIEIQGNVNARNLVPLKGVFYNVQDGFLVIALVMQYANEGSLAHFIRKRAEDGVPLTADEAKHLLREVLQGLVHLHANKVAHRDLKPDNILLHKDPRQQNWVSSNHIGGISFPIDGEEKHVVRGRSSTRPSPSSNVLSANETQDVTSSAEGQNTSFPKALLCDFGLAASFKYDALKTFCGTTEYLSPELIASRHFIGGIGQVLKESGASNVFDMSSTDSMQIPDMLVQRAQRVPYDEKCDMWSFGVIAFEIMTGFHPFRSRSKDATMRNIMRARVQWMASKSIKVLPSPFPVSRKEVQRVESLKEIEYDKQRGLRGSFTMGRVVNDDEDKVVLPAIQEGHRVVGRQSYALPSTPSRPRQTPLRARSFDIENSSFGLPPLFVDFIRRLLMVDPNQRMTAVDALKHPFLVV